MIERAYDIEIAKVPAELHAPDHGWVFGLPPGISPEQWPLDPATGYPMKHGFTLLLPEDYRCHGPELVAFSLFTSADPFADAPGDKTMSAAVLGDAEPADARYRPFWRRPESRHPRLSRMKDGVRFDWAVIFLTRTEFEGPLCPPPLPPRQDLAMDRTRRRIGGVVDEAGHVEWLDAPTCPRPGWLDRGGLRDYFDAWCSKSEASVAEWGGVPEAGLAVNRAILQAPRVNDPNAGKAPRSYWDRPPYVSDYTPPFYFDEHGQYQRRPWSGDHKSNHIGGTMRPTQVEPKFSPYYVEFGESFGGFNFGGGNAQFDFKEIKLEWAS